MQQRKQRKLARDSKPSIVSTLNEKAPSTLFSSRSQDTRSKLHLSKDSYVRQFRKAKPKLNTLSTISGINIQEQIKKEIAEVDLILQKCEKEIEQQSILRNQKAQFLYLQQAIRLKDETIKQLGSDIQHLKKNDRTPIDQDCPGMAHRHNQNSDKQTLFKLAQEMKHERQELLKIQADHKQKYQSYQKLKKLVEEIQAKYMLKNDGKRKEESYCRPNIITYVQYKQKMKNKKEEAPAKVKKIDFYHHITNQKATNPRNMKDLITRKNITLAALKNSRKKHGVEMLELVAKLDFLKDEDAHLNQKIKEKEQELAAMEIKFSQRKFQNHSINRNAVIRFHS